MTRIQALIFDFDGLIIETEGVDYQTWLEVYRSYGFDLPLEVFADVIGRGYDQWVFDPYTDLERKVGRPIPWDEVNRKRKQRGAELIAQLSILPGVLDYLDCARRTGLKIGLASSSSHDWVDNHLKRLGIYHHFEVIKCADDVISTKPNPDLYLAALSTLQVSPKHAIALEDSPNGVLAAKRAGMYCVAIPTEITKHLSFPETDMIISSLADLPLERLLQHFNGHEV